MFDWPTLPPAFQLGRDHFCQRQWVNHLHSIADCNVMCRWLDHVMPWRPSPAFHFLPFHYTCHCFIVLHYILIPSIPFLGLYCIIKMTGETPEVRRNRRSRSNRRNRTNRMNGRNIINRRKAKKSKQINQ